MMSENLRRSLDLSVTCALCLKPIIKVPSVQCLNCRVHYLPSCGKKRIIHRTENCESFTVIDTVVSMASKNVPSTGGEDKIPQAINKMSDRLQGIDDKLDRLQGDVDSINQTLADLTKTQTAHSQSIMQLTTLSTANQEKIHDLQGNTLLKSEIRKLF